MDFTLPALIASSKTVSAFPATGWIERDAEKLEWSGPLDVGGVTVEGFVLRLTANRYRSEQMVTAVLIHKPAKSARLGGALARIDWRPSHKHNNKGKGPPEYQFVEQDFSHYHRFDLNWNHSTETIKRNLPIAVPLNPDPPSFLKLLETISAEFKIDNVTGIVAPSWQDRLV